MLGSCWTRHRDLVPFRFFVDHPHFSPFGKAVTKESAAG
jgi:hypothetical protein